jgi:hypothetical protein
MDAPCAPSPAERRPRGLRGREYDCNLKYCGQQFGAHVDFRSESGAGYAKIIFQWRVSVTVAFSFLLALGAPISASAACQLLKIGDFKLRMDEGHPLIPVTINGKSGWVSISLQSNTSALYLNAIDELGLNTGPSNIYMITSHGEHAIRSVTTKLDFGGLSTTGSLVVDDVDKEPGPHIFGILGGPFFSDKVTEFDLADGIIRLFSAKTAAAALWPTGPIRRLSRMRIRSIRSCSGPRSTAGRCARV